MYLIKHQFELAHDTRMSYKYYVEFYDEPTKQDIRDSLIAVVILGQHIMLDMRNVRQHIEQY